MGALDFSWVVRGYLTNGSLVLRLEGQEGVDHVTVYVEFLQKEEHRRKLDAWLLLGLERRPIWLLRRVGAVTAGRGRGEGRDGR